jgi:hypothetical protein
MKHMYAVTYRVREGFQAATGLPRLRPVPSDAETDAVVASNARVDAIGGFAVHNVPGKPCPHIPRSNCAPAYYLGRPTSLWIKAMERRRQTARVHVARTITGSRERALSTYEGSPADARVETSA